MGAFKIPPYDLGVDTPKLDGADLPLNDAKVRALKPKAKPYKVSDYDGLYVHVSMSNVSACVSDLGLG